MKIFMLINGYLCKHKGNIGYFRHESLCEVLPHGFGTRLPSDGGRMPDDEIFLQKGQLCEALKVDTRSLLHLKQVHGDRIFVIKDTTARMTPGEYDGAVTNLSSVTLSILTADCLPILLYETKKKIIGVVHAGWRGTSLGILLNALTAVEQDFHGCSKNCMVLMGPCLRPCCFEIKEDALKILQERLSFWPEVINIVNKRIYFDLQLANIKQALEMDVPQENIWTLDLCTSCQPELFYSYRRDKEKAGRMISLISLR